MKTPIRLLTIAGSDSGGGAGIQADLKTFSALGGYGMSAITALTAQNTQGVRGIHEVPPAFVAEQIDAVLEDIGVDAVKIGMLASPAIITAVADRLRHHRVARVVLDPVMVATSGDKLLRDDAIEALQAELFPLATVLTPNAREAEVLLGRPLRTDEDAAAAARDLLARGPGAVLVKGGHFDGTTSSDVLAGRGEADVRWFRAPRIDTRNTHGTGCTLSAAIAAGLGRGLLVFEAVREAKAYISAAITAGATLHIGRGHGPVHHFYALAEWRRGA
ncbi:MAG TPA: bifunctional hydroxymethylpyrimidine kinase/phosphomethylpyrimidine kinase [Kiritimatiellia bacterium]|nr:bifunctional hydroxymethylpyrimidine kinase/phosphomethylpyrimidine kinase [Kiritimatiellia bacterium]